MAIRITEDGTVIYENEPDVNRELFGNLPGGYASPEQIVQAVDEWLEEHPEATTTVTDGSITREKLDSELNSYIEDLSNSLSPVPYDKDAQLTIIEGEYVRSSDGEIIADANYDRTDYFNSNGAKTVTLIRTDPAKTGECNSICFFDVNKKFVSAYTSAMYTTDMERSFEVPQTTAYIMFSGSKGLPQFIKAELNVPSAVSDKADVIRMFPDILYVKQPVLLGNIIGVTKFPGNLVVNTDCIDKQYVDYSSGKIAINKPNYFRTGYIPVTAGKTYRANHGRNLAWYDSNYTYISGVAGVGIQTGVAAPENAAFIRFSISKTSDGISSPIDLYFADTDTYDTSVTIDDLVASNVKPWCYGKKINWIGDSIVDGADFDEEVCGAVGLVKESEYGINGSTFALNGDGTNTRNALCERYISMSDDADIIAVSCGTNDWMYAWSPIGTIESTENTTLYGALKTLCQGLINKYPQKVIFFTTPIKRAQAFANGDGGEYTADGVNTTPFSKNKYGKTLGDYADIIKEVCGYYSIPVLDMYRESLLNPHIASQQNMFDSALTHPNAAGQKIMARRVAGWISQLGYVIDGLNG